MSLDQTYRALSDPSRREILRRLATAPGLTVSELAEPLPIGMPTVMKHLGILARANLIHRRKAGRSVTITLAPDPMAEAKSWLEQTEQVWSARLDRLATLVEQEKP
jgi:DNA-binding transcriptional ArsR family regulator